MIWYIFADLTTLYELYDEATVVLDGLSNISVYIKPDSEIKPIREFHLQEDIPGNAKYCNGGET